MKLIDIIAYILGVLAGIAIGIFMVKNGWIQ